MKQLFLAICMLGGLTAAHAQANVKGLLRDSLSQEPIPYVTVRVYVADKPQTALATVLSTDEGAFTTTIPAQGQYTLVCSMAGLSDASRTLTIKDEREIDLGTILMSDNSTMLSGVEVVAQKPIVRMEADRMTYSVEDDVDSRASTVLDMLRKVPMVTVDGQDNIQVNGSSSFKVYVDDKPNAMLSQNPSQIFKAMPANMVRSIEVVTSPGAKYDAEGAGGILILRMANVAGGQGQVTNEHMYNGSAYVNGGNRGGGGGLTLGGQKKRFNYHTDLHFNYVDNGTVKISLDRAQSDGTQNATKMHATNTVPVTMGNIAVGYEIDKMSSINASLGITNFHLRQKSDPHSSVWGGSIPSKVSFASDMLFKMNSMQYNGSLDYQRFLREDKQSSLTITYQINATPTDKDTRAVYGNNPAFSTTPYNFANRRNVGDEKTLEHTLQADLVTRLTDHSKLNSGLKYANRRVGSAMDYYNHLDLRVDSLCSDYAHHNHIGAIYAESENQWGQWSAKAGLRYEHTWQLMKQHEPLQPAFRNNYGNLVPSVTASYSTNNGQNVGLTYNMRISRPGITYLNPYRERSDATQLTYGNPDLEVEKTHNVSAVYNLYRQKVVFNATLRQTFAKGGIEEYRFYDPSTSLMNVTYGNIVDRSQTALNIFLSWSASKTTRVILNGGGSYTHLESSQLNQSNSGWAGNGTLSVQQQLPKQWNAGLTVVGSSKTYTLQGWNTGANLAVLTISKSLLKDRLNISVMGLTGLSKGGNLNIDQYSKGPDFESNLKVRVPLYRGALTIRYSFGNTAKQFQKRASKVTSDYIEHQNSSQSIGTSSSM